MNGLYKFSIVENTCISLFEDQPLINKGMSITHRLTHSLTMERLAFLKFSYMFLDRLSMIYGIAELMWSN